MQTAASFILLLVSNSDNYGFGIKYDIQDFSFNKK